MLPLPTFGVLSSPTFGVVASPTFGAVVEVFFVLQHLLVEGCHELFGYPQLGALPKSSNDLVLEPRSGVHPPPDDQRKYS